MQLAGQMFSRHHRQLRRHGDHSAANLILLCGSGTTGCHGWVHANPALSYEMGWLLKGWQTPEVEPVSYAVITGYIQFRIFADGSRLLAA